MPRRPVVIAILALLAAVLLVPIVLLVTAGPAADVPMASDEPPAGVEPLRVDDVAWVFAMPLFEGPMETYSLQAGLLGKPDPVIDLQVPFGVDPNMEPWRRPAVGSAVDGSVVHVADDGAHSSVRRVAIAPDGLEEELAVLDEVVYSIAVAPDGDHAYLALADRADPERDLGIVRLSLDGLARIERIFDPAPGAANEQGIALAAVAGFNVDITLSMDGRHLVRAACAGAAGCGQQVIDVESGAVLPVGDRRILSVAGGIVLVQQCAAECAVELIDLASGAIQRLPAIQWDATMTLIGGQPRVAFVDTTQGAEVLRAIDPRDGSSVELFSAPLGSGLTLAAVSPDLRIALPAGYILVSVNGEEVGAIIEVRTIAIPLDGGQLIEIPMAPFRMEFHGVQG